MMSASWDEPVVALCAQEPPTWEGLWALLYTAARATTALALSIPVTDGVDLTLAAMDLHEAREELDWVRPDLRSRSTAVSLGAPTQSDDPTSARTALGHLVDACMVRCIDLAPHELAADGDTALTRVLTLVRRAAASITPP